MDPLASVWVFGYWVVLLLISAAVLLGLWLFDRGVTLLMPVLGFDGWPWTLAYYVASLALLWYVPVPEAFFTLDPDLEDERVRLACVEGLLITFGVLACGVVWGVYRLVFAMYRWRDRRIVGSDRQEP